VRRAPAVLTAALAAVLLTACAGEDRAQTRTTPAAVVPSDRPKITVPSGPPPTRLVTKDIRTGTGALALPGKVVTVHYVGALYRNGKEFDASWDRGHPFTFRLGNQDVIPGWDQGVLSMHVGGRRELIIPPDLAYGAEGRPPEIPPSSTLIFVVDLISVSGDVGGADGAQ
jgi:FKBP-type peptidyl-prolyl cis-trans isomerase